MFKSNTLVKLILQVFTVEFLKMNLKYFIYILLLKRWRWNFSASIERVNLRFSKKFCQKIVPNSFVENCLDLRFERDQSARCTSHDWKCWSSCACAESHTRVWWMMMMMMMESVSPRWRRKVLLRCAPCKINRITFELQSEKRALIEKRSTIISSIFRLKSSLDFNPLKFLFIESVSCGTYIISRGHLASSLVGLVLRISLCPIVFPKTSMLKVEYTSKLLFILLYNYMSHQLTLNEAVS